MSLKNWNNVTVWLNAAPNWSSNSAPAAGDNLYMQSGVAVLANRTFGSAAVQTTIGLIGATAASAPSLVLQNVTLKNVKVSEAPPPYTGPVSGSPPGYYSAKYGMVWVKGTVTNDGGIMQGGRDSLGPTTGLKILLNSGSALINKGVLSAFPGGQLTVSGLGPATVENDGTINAAGGRFTISIHLTGVGDTYTSAAGGGFSGKVGVSRTQPHGRIGMGCGAV